jgi:hypothetical protein
MPVVPDRADRWQSIAAVCVRRSSVRIADPSRHGRIPLQAAATRRGALPTYGETSRKVAGRRTMTDPQGTCCGRLQPASFSIGQAAGAEDRRLSSPVNSLPVLNPVATSGRGNRRGREPWSTAYDMEDGADRDLLHLILAQDRLHRTRSEFRCNQPCRYVSDPEMLQQPRTQLLGVAR